MRWREWKKLNFSFFSYVCKLRARFHLYLFFSLCSIAAAAVVAASLCCHLYFLFFSSSCVYLLITHISSHIALLLMCMLIYLFIFIFHYMNLNVLILIAAAAERKSEIASILFLPLFNSKKWTLNCNFTRLPLTTTTTFDMRLCSYFISREIDR